MSMQRRQGTFVSSEAKHKSFNKPMLLCLLSHKKKVLILSLTLCGVWQRQV